MRITHAQLELLEHADSIWRKMEWHVTSSRVFRRCVIDRCVKDGLLESVGMVEMADADGFLRPNAFPREGFQLTDKGKLQLKMRAEFAVGVSVRKE